MLNDYYVKLIKTRENPAIETPEDLCRKCGLCCLDKSALPDGSIIYLESKCQWQQSDNSCKIYKNRMIVFKHCVTARIALYLCILPRYCPYVIKNWHLIKDWYIPPIIPKNIYDKYRKGQNNEGLPIK
jgi:uncharacterized cysteine cluster protein YcgN (CxxCxxCC family)